ncbi:MAG TPA: DUF3299 domain-containing protein [Opitutus sp.]|nr:DUF3299 domain-containing protein [Opitutus sp.]
MLSSALVVSQVEVAAGREPPKASPVRVVTFSELAGFSLASGGSEPALPLSVSEARDRPVSIRGYLLPLAVEGGRAREFLVMRDQSACCYGRPPAANEFVVARTDGAGLPLTMDVPVTVHGTLRIDPLIVAGDYVQFYRLEGVRLISP